MSKTYTDKEKIAYYKAKANGAPVKAVRTYAKKPVAKATYTRKSTTIHGRGDYVVPKPVKTTSSAIKLAKEKPHKSIGQKVGSAIGAGLGLGAEQLIRWISGMGDYSVEHNVLLNTGNPPMMKNYDNTGGTVLRRREFLTDIKTSAIAGGFKLDKFSLNPGSQFTFPWLSQIAVNYEQYSFEGVIFEFRSMSADALNSTNTALGTVIMATNYNAASPVFDQKAEMENYEFGGSCRPSEDLMHPIECARHQTTVSEPYIRSGALPPDQDIRLYDWGNFQIATNGFQGTEVNIGELWVTYQVALYKPKMYTSLGNYNDVYRAGTTVLGTIQVPFGSPANFQIVNNTIGIAYDSSSGASRFSFSGAYASIKQSYYITMEFTGSTAITVASPNIATNMQIQPWQTAGTVPQLGVTTTLYQYHFTCSTAGDGVVPYFTIQLSAIPGGSPSASTIKIIQMPNNIIIE